MGGGSPEHWWTRPGRGCGVRPAVPFVRIALWKGALGALALLSPVILTETLGRKAGTASDMHFIGEATEAPRGEMMRPGLTASPLRIWNPESAPGFLSIFTAAQLGHTNRVAVGFEGSSGSHIPPRTRNRTRGREVTFPRSSRKSLVPYPVPPQPLPSLPARAP